MKRKLKIGIIGDFNPQSRFHLVTNKALDHAAGALSCEVDAIWLPTNALAGDFDPAALDIFDGFWCSPGSPYHSLEGALAGIRFARERLRPFIGT